MPSLAYKTASDDNRRRLVKSLVENFTWNDNKLMPDWKKECLPIQNRDKNLDGSATGQKLANSLLHFLFAFISGFALTNTNQGRSESDESDYPTIPENCPALRADHFSGSRRYFILQPFD